MPTISLISYIQLRIFHYFQWGVQESHPPPVMQQTLCFSFSFLLWMMHWSILLLLWPNSAASFGSFHRQTPHHRWTQRLTSSSSGRILRWAETTGSSSSRSSISNEEKLSEELAFLIRELTAYLAVRDQVGADEQAKQYVLVPCICDSIPLRPKAFVCGQELSGICEKS
jgi:hypothetical protein